MTSCTHLSYQSLVGGPYDGSKACQCVEPDLMRIGPVLEGHDPDLPDRFFDLPCEKLRQSHWYHRRSGRWQYLGAEPVLKYDGAMTILITDINGVEHQYGGVSSQVLTGNLYTLTIPQDGEGPPKLILWNWNQIRSVVVQP